MITHHHFDHYGLAATLRRAGVPELLMHARDWERAHSISRPAARKTIGPAMRGSRATASCRAIRATKALPAAGKSCEPTQLVADGERVGRLEAVWTPGHSPGHLCFADTRSGRMLTGDHVLDPITPHVGLWRGREGDPMGDYLASLEKVRGRGAGRRAAGARRALSRPRPADRRTARAHRRSAKARSWRRSRTGAASAGEIARRLPWTRRNRAFAGLGEWHQQFAVSETIAHLQHLFVRGRVTRAGGPDPIRYMAAA